MDISDQIIHHYIVQCLLPASSSDALSDASPYSVSLQHPAAATYVPGSHEEDASTTSAAAQLYGPSTLSLSQPGSSVSRGRRPAVLFLFVWEEGGGVVLFV